MLWRGILIPKKLHWFASTISSAARRAAYSRLAWMCSGLSCGYAASRKDDLAGFTGSKFLQNQIDGNSRSFETGLAHHHVCASLNPFREFHILDSIRRIRCASAALILRRGPVISPDPGGTIASMRMYGSRSELGVHGRPVRTSQRNNPSCRIETPQLTRIAGNYEVLPLPGDDHDRRVNNTPGPGYFWKSRNHRFDIRTSFDITRLEAKPATWRRTETA